MSVGEDDTGFGAKAQTALFQLSPRKGSVPLSDVGPGLLSFVIEVLLDEMAGKW